MTVFTPISLKYSLDNDISYFTHQINVVSFYPKFIPSGFKKI